MLKKIMTLKGQKHEGKFMSLVNELKKMTDDEVKHFMKKAGVTMLSNDDNVEREVLAAVIVSEISTGEGYLTMNDINYSLKEITKMRIKKYLARKINYEK